MNTTSDTAATTAIDRLTALAGRATATAEALRVQVDGPGVPGLVAARLAVMVEDSRAELERLASDFLGDG